MIKNKKSGYAPKGFIQKAGVDKSLAHFGYRLVALHSPPAAAGKAAVFKCRVNGIKVKDANGKDITSNFTIKKGNISTTDGTINEDGTVTVPAGSDVAFYVNSKTKTRGWAAQTATENSIIVTDLPAKQADKPNGYAAIPGGIMIQLPSSIGTTEPVTIEFELVDVFGVTKTLSVTVKAAK